MKPGDQLTDEEVAEIIARGSQVRRAPDVVRARLLARARGALAAAERTRVPTFGFERAPPRRAIRIAVAAIVLLAFAAGGAAAMIHSRATPVEAVEVAPVRSASPLPVRPPVQAAAAEVPAPRVVARPRSFHRVLTPQESYAAELGLLRGAQAEYASRHFSDALALAGEHARRFPNGRLAEEREALRVRSLAGAGRGGEARRVLAAFAKRFPRSVLLPRLQESARTAEE